VINSQEFDVLQRFWKVRNAVVHEGKESDEDVLGAIASGLDIWDRLGARIPIEEEIQDRATARFLEHLANPSRQIFEEAERQIPKAVTHPIDGSAAKIADIIPSAVRDQVDVPTAIVSHGVAGLGRALSRT
jgi:hypothetical protein